MGRYRPPQQPGSLYITAEGKQRLEKELDHLWRERRPEVVRALAAAAAEGDRSENAEYIYRKKELGGIDRRVRFLRKRLEGLKVVDSTPSDTTRVFFGAWVRLEDAQGDIHEYRIVGPDEFDPQRNWISMDSPLARALMGKTLDDEIRIELPKGMQDFAILAISYQGLTDSEEQPA